MIRRSLKRNRQRSLVLHGPLVIVTRSYWIKERVGEPRSLAFKPWMDNSNWRRTFREMRFSLHFDLRTWRNGHALGKNRSFVVLVFLVFCLWLITVSCQHQKKWVQPVHTSNQRGKMECLLWVPNGSYIASSNREHLLPPFWICLN